MINYTLHIYENSCNMDEFVNSCINIDKFLKICNKCNINFGKNWMCPPFNFDPIDIWQNYKNIKLTAWQLIFDKSSIISKGTDPLLPAVVEFKKEKARLQKILLAEEKQQPGSLSLMAGSCELCKTCARISNVPCRHPDMARHSLESLGADVFKAVHKFLDIDIILSEHGILPDYLMLVGALLIK